MSKLSKLSCFKAYDVRGKLDVEIDEKIAFKIGFATAQTLRARNVVVGHDARESSPSLSNSVIRGVRAYGADVLNLGLAGTEEVYFAVANSGADAGIEVTASHNPINYNGMKIVKSGSKPLTQDEFLQIKLLAEEDNFTISAHPGQLEAVHKQAKTQYIKKIANFINLNSLKPLKIVLNSGNGVAGPIIDQLERYLNLEGVETHFTKVHHEPNSSFPHGIPNPLLENNRVATSEVVKAMNADFGVAFDGDFDRCFIFDNEGEFIPSEYIVGMLAEVFLNKEPGATIIHDSRVIFNTNDILNTFGGHAMVSRTGHTFVKAEMRAQNAVYGGEMSAHHYFRDFNFCDSGMIPWLLVWELLSQKSLLLSDLIEGRKKKFPSSGEMNFKVSNSQKCLQKIEEIYAPIALFLEKKDGLSASFDSWRFNIRRSNTEPLVRLNVETKANEELLFEKTKELSNLISTMDCDF